MKTYHVYLGSAEQFKYTYTYQNLKHLKESLKYKFSSLQGRWYRQPTEGCPTGSKRYLVKGRADGFYHKSC